MTFLPKFLRSVPLTPLAQGVSLPVTMASRSQEPEFSNGAEYRDGNGVLAGLSFPTLIDVSSLTSAGGFGSRHFHTASDAVAIRNFIPDLTLMGAA